MLTHVDAANRPTMVDVSHKKPTDRTAHARTIVEFPVDVASRFSGGDIETAKGPVFATASVGSRTADGWIVCPRISSVPLQSLFSRYSH